MIMTHLYQNTAFESGKSVFIDTTNAEHAQAIFTAKAVRTNASNGKVKMTRGKVTLRQETDVETCGDACTVPITESVTLEFSVLDGAANLGALRTELNRLIDVALASYQLGGGLVPPSYATFAV